MERVDAKNQLEAYLYNTRNAVQEEKVKETLGAETVKEVEGWVKEGIEWLDQNPDASKTEFEEKQKAYEEKIRPVLTKMYEEAGAPGQAPQATQASQAPSGKAPSGPNVEEVD
jgi:L1 cell adhesion molecule like protein